MTDVNSNGIQTQEVTLYDKDGNSIDESHPLVTALPAGAATAENQNSLLTELQKKADFDEEQPIVPSDNVTISEFGEQRTASPGNRADFEFLYDKQPLFFDDISTGGGTVTHRPNERDLLLSIVNTTTGTVAGERQHYWTPYTPGNGQEGEVTFVADLLNLGGSASVFLRSTVSGVTTLQTVPQESWIAKNTGVNWNYSHILRWSFQSLRVGRIQFSLVSGGVVTKFSEILNDNLRGSGYWQYASLPPYWKLYNEAGNAVFECGYGDELNGIGFRYVFNGKYANAQSVAICETVKSQGGADLFNMAGLPFTTPILPAKTVGNTLIPVISIRVAETFNGIANRELVIPQIVSLQTDNPIEWVVYYRPSLTGASWQPINTTYHGIEYDVSATIISGGLMVKHDTLSSGNNNIARANNLLGKIIMSLGSTGTADILGLAAVRTGASSAAVKSVIEGIEIR